MFRHWTVPEVAGSCSKARRTSTGATEWRWWCSPETTMSCRRCWRGPETEDSRSRAFPRLGGNRSKIRDKIRLKLRTHRWCSWKRSFVCNTWTLSTASLSGDSSAWILLESDPERSTWDSSQTVWDCYESAYDTEYKWNESAQCTTWTLSRSSSHCNKSIHSWVLARYHSGVERLSSAQSSEQSSPDSTDRGTHSDGSLMDSCGERSPGVPRSGLDSDQTMQQSIAGRRRS